MTSTSSDLAVSPGPRDKHGLCLLSLDGGGVRGLSTLLILKGVMQQINAKRRLQELSYVKPCDVFDLIGGTSTGGLIAIMLGRLQMDVQECIDAYSILSKDIFSRKGLPINWRGEVTGRYKSSELEKSIKRIVREAKSPEDARLNDGKDRGCRIFVCAVRKENKAVARLRSYESATALIEDGATIWEAARATSAASSFFDPITIGKHGLEYVDAGLGCNNPVDEVWTEAQDIWSPEEDDLGILVKCFISIGTGDPGTNPINDGIFKMFTKTLKDIATETEATAGLFAKKHRGLLSQKRYFRFYVDQGLQNVGLEEHEKEKEIVAATTRYMESQVTLLQTRECAQAMKDKELWSGETNTRMNLIILEHRHAREKFHLNFSLSSAPDISYFVGRARDLQSIEAVLLPFTAAERKVLVLHGLGGIGKSQLAVEYAKRHRQDYSAVLWLNAKAEDTLKQSFAEYARRLPKHYIDQEILYEPQNEASLIEITRGIRTWLSLSGNDQWLIIFDNVDNPKIPDNKRANAYDVRSYYPEAYQGSIIVTTRWQSLRIGHLHKVAKLSRTEESISLLEKLSGRVDICEEPAIEDLLTRLDGLPLALATAGAYLGLDSMPVLEYLQHYDKSWLELQQTSPRLRSYEDQTLYSTWNLSYMHIRKEDEATAKLLELWAYFDNQDVWFKLLEAGKNDESPAWFLSVVRSKLAFAAAIAKLQKHALIERLTQSDGYSMHHCVYSWVKTVLWTAIEREKLEVALTCVSRTVPLAPAPGDWKIGQRLLPHAERCLRLLSLWTENKKCSDETIKWAIEFFNELGILYHGHNKLIEAESMFQRALNSREKVLGPDHASTLDMVNNVGLLYREQGKLREAELMVQRALTGKEKVLGPDHASTLETVNNLGILYRDQGMLREAELMVQRALIGKEKVLGPDHASTLSTVNDLGLLYRDQGKLKEAESMAQRALTGKQIALGQKHTLTLDMVNNLGNVYHVQGKLKEAESMFQRALADKEEVLGPDHISTLIAVNNLGILYRDQCKLEEAESMLQRALTGKKRALGLDHTSTLDTIHNLGITYCAQGKLEEAGLMLQRALNGYEKAYRPDHIIMLDTFNNLGVLYLKQGKLAEAEEMYQRTLSGNEKARGPEHITTLDTVHNLGTLYKNQGKLTEAETMYQRALSGKEKAYGPEHTSILQTVNNLGLLYISQGKLAEAEKMFQRVLRGKEKAYGPEHTSTLDTVNNLGILYPNRGKLTEAEEMLQRALRGKEKTYGPEHISTLDTVNSLGNLYKNQGKLEEAELMFQRALTGKEKALGPDHISMLETVNNLGILYHDQGKLEEAEPMFQRALTGKEKALGPDHTSTLDTVNNLGALHGDRGKLEEAESMFQRALTGIEKALGPDHTSTLNTVNNLGILYHNQGKLEEAEPMVQRALTGKEKALGPDHISTLNTVNNLGNLFRDRGKLEKAESMYQRALAGYRNNPESNPIRQLVTYYNMALLSRKLHDFDKALGYLEQAHEGYSRFWGPQNPKTIEALFQIERTKQERTKNESTSKQD